MSNSILDGLTYKSEEPTFNTEITPEMLEQLNPRQLETVSAIQTANQLFGDSGLSDVSDFMTNLSMTESNIGGDKEWGGSYSPFQIDPIGYEDIVSKGKAGERATLDRASIANQLLEGMGYGQNFDILNLNLDEIRDPMISSLLTRMKLGTIAESIPTDLQGQADYWKKYWNTTAGKGTPEHFIGQVQDYNKKLKIKTHDGTPIK